MSETATSRYERHRRRQLPHMLEATRAKLIGLVREAERYGMLDILTEEEQQCLNQQKNN